MLSGKEKLALSCVTLGASGLLLDQALDVHGMWGALMQNVFCLVTFWLLKCILVLRMHMCG